MLSPAWRGLMGRLSLLCLVPSMSFLLLSLQSLVHNGRPVSLVLEGIQNLLLLFLSLLLFPLRLHR